jgi:hypothetical protein
MAMVGGISTDGCNATGARCDAGGRLDLWSSPALHGAKADWQYIGPMFTSNRSYPLPTGVKHDEFVTSNYFGGTSR